MKTQSLITYSELFRRLASRLAENEHPRFDFVVVDESQDVSVAQLRFLAALAAGRPNSLFCAGDLGQRIFQQPFSWKSIGVDIRGRSRTLRINYRTSHQIRMQADRLLAPELSDVDGNTEKRGETISVFNGPKPIVMELATREEEIRTVSQWLLDRKSEGGIPVSRRGSSGNVRCYEPRILSKSKLTSKWMVRLPTMPWYIRGSAIVPVCRRQLWPTLT